MSIRRTFAITFVVAATVCLFRLSPVKAIAAAQTPKQEQGDLVIKQDVRMVLLDAAVTNRAGNFVTGLSRDRFTVFEDGKSQPIQTFDNSDLPITLGILVDESESMTPKRSAVLAASEKLITEANPHDEFFVINFNDRVTRGLPPAIQFSGNISQLKTALFRGIPQGRTSLYDAVADGLKQLAVGHHGRKALVVISDGGDNASHRTRAEMLESVESSGATVFGIGIYTPGDPEIDPGVLKQIARASGGEALFPSEPSEMTAACERIAKEIRQRYVIGYRPPEGLEGKLRHIRVKVSNDGESGLTATVRGSYRYGVAPEK